MDLFTTNCILCGFTMPKKCSKRTVDAAELSALVRGSCQESPVVHRYISNKENFPPNYKATICIPCVNWKRRCAKPTPRKKTRKTKPMLQMDQMLCYVLDPGAAAEPDNRCVQRLITAMTDKANPYRPLYPSSVLDILKMSTGNTLDHITVAWWEYNHRTKFFSSQLTAKRVRASIKKLGINVEK